MRDVLGPDDSNTLCPHGHMPMRTFDEYLALSCNQIRRYGASEPRVIEALLDMLGKISYDTANPERRACLARHVRLAVAAAEGSVRQREDVQTVRQVGEALLELLKSPPRTDLGSRELKQTGQSLKPSLMGRPRL